MMMKKGRADLANAHDRVMAEGIPYGALFQLNSKCRWCGEYETLNHRWHGCNAIEKQNELDEFESEWLQKSKWVSRQAKLHSYKPACLWHRAILPSSWSFDMTERVDTDEVCIWMHGEIGQEFHTDGAGPPGTMEVPTFGQSVGCAAVSVKWSQDNVVEDISCACRVYQAIKLSQGLKRTDAFVLIKWQGRRNSSGRWW